jgi:hypothetical protein
MILFCKSLKLLASSQCLSLLNGSNMSVLCSSIHKTYHLPSISSKKGIAALHDHSNHIRTIGLGEFIAVLNGVEFRTRHNDFLLPYAKHLITLFYTGICCSLETKRDACMYFQYLI